MKIEIDKFYRTRDGQKVYVYKYNDDERKFAGAILGSISLFWHYDGSAVEGSETELDLVAPWKDEND